MRAPLTFNGRLPGVVCEAALPPQDESPLRLDVTGFVGFAERGPLNIPVALHDIGQYRAVFGGDLPLARMPQGNQIVYANLHRAVQAFFDNGGRRCYVVRVAGPHAQANQFRIPGLLAWDSTADNQDNVSKLRPVVAPAAWFGRWSASMGVGTQLLSQPLSLTKQRIQWFENGDFTINLILPNLSSLKQKDILRLHFNGPGKPIIYCSVDSVQKKDTPHTTGSGISVLVSLQTSTTQAFTKNISPVPQPISVRRQQSNESKALNTNVPYLDELTDSDDGYVLHVTSAEQIRQADTLYIDCLGREDLLFPVESVTQESHNGNASSEQRNYVLTSRSPTWKLMPTEVKRLTSNGWEPLNWVWLPAQELEVRMTRNARECILHLEVDDASQIQIGDVLLVTCLNGSQLLFPVSDVQIPPLEDVLSSPPSALHISSPPAATDAQVISQQVLWLLEMPSSSPPIEDSYGYLQQVDLLTFNLYIREKETIVETWNDLRFADGVANSWLDVLVPSADDLREEIAHPAVTRRDIPGLDPTRSAWLGKPNPFPQTSNGAVVKPLYFPLGMDDLPLPDEFAVPFIDSTVPNSAPTGGTDDLDSFDPISLFLDGRLVDVGYRDLLNEANAILFASADVLVDPFMGLHSLLFIDEIGIIALPDLPQRGWKKKELPPEQPLCLPPSTPPSEKRDWSLFLKCDQQQPKQSNQQPSEEPKPELDLPTIESPDKYHPEELQALIAVQQALVHFCAARADVLGVLTLPLHFKRREVLDWQQRFKSTPSFLDGVPLSYVAVYHPWLQVHEEVPLQALVSRSVPPDGTVCGMIAARELARGPWIAPANVPLLGVIGLSPDFSTSDWRDLFNAQINLVRQLPGQYTLMSTHTLSLEDTFLQISVRRLLIFLRKLCLLRGMRYVFEANNERFRARVQASFEAALRIMMQRGAITAFEVVTDGSVNTQNDYDNGRFVIAIKVAPTQPIEFITVVLLRSSEDLLQVIEG